MTIPENINVKSLREAYILANTPGYLYKRFLENPSVHRLARTQTTDELLGMYRAAVDTNDPTADDIALGYAALVAVTLKDYREARAALERLRNNDLRWADSIIEMFLLRPTSINTRTIIAPTGCHYALAPEIRVTAINWMIVSKGSSLDRDSGELSIFSVMSGSAAAGFPLFLPQVVVVVSLTRESTDPEIADATVRVMLGDQELVRGAVGVDFQGSKNTHTILNIQGLVLPEAGNLVFHFEAVGIGNKSATVAIEQLPALHRPSRAQPDPQRNRVQPRPSWRAFSCAVEWAA